jgi:very-short-patch-repair endonuclease
MPSTDSGRALRRRSTDAERLLWRLLRGRQLTGLKFRRQQPVGRYVVDFVCLEQRLVIEVDGGQHAWRREADDEREAWLARQGYRVLRFWNNEVLRQPDAVLRSIDRAVRTN